MASARTPSRILLCRLHVFDDICIRSGVVSAHGRGSFCIIFALRSGTYRCSRFATDKVPVILAPDAKLWLATVIACFST